MLEQALWYWKRGFIVLPLTRNSKKPPKDFPLADLRWTMPTETQIREWFKAPCNIAIQPTDWQAIDLDREDWLEVLKQHSIPDTYSYTTTRGVHAWLRGWNGTKLDHAEVMGKDWDRKYVVVPPSVVDGVKRTWRCPPDRLKDLRVTNLPIVTRLSPENALFKKEHCHVHDMKNLYKGGVTLRHPESRINLREGGRDESLYHVATCLKRGGMLKADATKVLEILGENCVPPYDALPKIVSAYDVGLPSERILSEEIGAWVSVTHGWFSVTDMDRDLGIVTQRDRANRRQVMSRLANRGKVQRSKKEGQFRRVEDELTEINLQKEPQEGLLDLKWPLELEEYVGLYPGTMCVINGVKDAGKTAFLLRFAMLNQDKWPKRVHYFNSEMGETELLVRLSKAGIPKKDRKFRAYDRNQNFSEVIQPDDINLIDFLEIHKDFAEIGSFMWEIHDKLDTGVAIVAIQKNPGAELGLGGYRSIEKARLVLNLEGNTLIIHSAKGWANPEVNPRKKEIRYKLVQGYTWLRDDHSHEGKYGLDSKTMSVRRSHET